MGLDITAYRQLRAAAEGEGRDPEFPDEYDYKAGYTRLYENDDFPGRAEGAPVGVIVKAEEEHRFRAGSYSGYNLWREQLAELAQYPVAAHPGKYHAGEMSRAAAAWSGDVDSGPFYELVNFSDCEGTIGPVVAKKLAADFAAFQEKADAHPDEWFRQKYADWRKAFEMAADGGAVCFH